MENPVSTATGNFVCKYPPHIYALSSSAAVKPPRLILVLIFLLATTPCPALDFKTRSGATYKNCKVLEVQPDRLRIMHSQGITSVDLADLPEPLQKQYHYDPAKAEAAKAERAKAEKRAPAPTVPPQTDGNVVERSQSDAGPKAFDSIRVGNLEEAHRWLLAAISADPGRGLYSEIDRHLEALIRSLNHHRFVQQSLPGIRQEIERRRRNAAIADRPNVLNPHDNSNQVRAANMRAEADQMERDAQQQIEGAQEQIERELGLLNSMAEKQATVGAFAVALDLTDMIGNIAAHYLTGRTFAASITRADQIRLRRHVDAASKHLLIAKDDAAAKKLVAAQKAAEEGLREEPGRYELQSLFEQLRNVLEECGKIGAEAQALRDRKQYEQSLEKIRIAQARCVDQPDIERLASELGSLISEKEIRLAKAKTDEEAGEFESALRTYDTYDVDDAIKRVTPKLGKLREERGDFLAAYALYEKANMTLDMQRIRALRDNQTMAYDRAKTFIAQGKFDDAIAVFEKYKDGSARRAAMLQKAVFLEGEEKFDDALQVYSAADASLEVSRLRTFLSDRKKIIAEAINLERAANFDAALELFRKANAKSDIERVASALARDFEKKQDFESATQYFEMAGLYEEAGRVRKSHDLAKASSKRVLSGPEIFKRCAPACVTVVNKGVGLGSGFFVAKGGYVLTNHHVVEHASEIRILTSTNKWLDAKLVSDSKMPDLALLQANIGDNPVLDLGDSNLVETGAHVSAIGTPKGLAQSFTAGNVSSTDRQKFGNECFQISVLINHGNSGGPLLDDFGRVVGINTYGEGTLVTDEASGLAIGSDVQGVNYAIKVNEAKTLLNQIRR